MERANVSCRGAKFQSVVYHVHKYNVILFERVTVMIALSVINVSFEGDSPLSSLYSFAIFWPQLPYQGKRFN